MSRRSARNSFLALSIHLGLAAGIGMLGCGEARQTNDLPPKDEVPNGVVGTLHARIASYEDHAETSYRIVREDGQEIALDFGSHSPSALVGQKIAVRGTSSGNRIAVDAFDVLRSKADELAQPLRAAPAKKTIKIAAISLTTAMTKDALAKRVFTDPDSPAAFYRDNSYGDWTLEGTAYGPYTIATTDCSETNLYTIADQAATAAAADGFDPANFDNIMYYIVGTTGCTYGGIAEVGVNEVRGFINAKYSWYRGSGCVVLAQELGHNFGLLHSHKCTSGPYIASAYGGTACAGYNEYGDTYTPMGGGCGHFNAIESGALGFISGCNTLDVTTSGTFEIGPIEAKCDGPQVIRVPTNTMANVGPQYVFLEYRRGMGSVASDTRSPAGVYFHASSEYGGNRTTIDSGAGHDYDYALDPFYIHDPLATADATWTEPQSGATFTLKSIGNTATVEVTIPNTTAGAAKCIGGATPPSAPTCSMIVSPEGGTPPDAGTGGRAGDAAPDTGSGGSGTADAAPETGSSGAAGAGTGGSTGGSSGTGGTAGTGSSSSGCSCSILGGNASTGAPAALLALAALLPAMRRRRQRRPN